MAKRAHPSNEWQDVPMGRVGSRAPTLHPDHPPRHGACLRLSLACHHPRAEARQVKLMAHAHRIFR